VQPKFRAAAVLVAVGTTLVGAQTASAAALGLSVSAPDGRGALAPRADVELASSVGVTTASAHVSTQGVSAAVDTTSVTARVHVGGRAPGVSDDPPALGPGPRTAPRTGSKEARGDSRALRDHVTPTVVRDRTAPPTLERPTGLALHATPADALTGIDLPPLPERSSDGWSSFVKAPATGVSGSAVALVGMLLVFLSLLFQPFAAAVRAARPSLLSFALQRPG
jgi:hypothetical protein